METKKVEYTWKTYLVIALILIPLCIAGYFQFEKSDGMTRISFPAATSDEVSGYKLYYVKDAQVSYESESFDLGRSTSINLSLKLQSGKYNIGIVSYDSDQVESSMTFYNDIFVK